MPAGGRPGRLDWVAEPASKKRQDRVGLYIGRAGQQFRGPGGLGRPGAQRDDLDEQAHRGVPIGQVSKSSGDQCGSRLLPCPSGQYP
jgi:hypothetical protein